jgi:diacylglycerol kinase family enzyme
VRRVIAPERDGVLGFSAHLIVNPAAGSAASLRGSLTEAARERGIQVRVLEPGQDARLAAFAAVEDGAESLAVAGGDGSVAAVAGVAVECELPLVIVPMCTLNHFARDLGLDLAHPLGALDAFYGGYEERRVDVGRINGRLFINNVSLGVYAQMLGDPGYRQDKLRVAQAKLQAAFSDPELRRALRIAPPEEALLEGIIAMVVSNNPYEFARWDRLGQRRRLDTGMLQVSVLDASALEELEWLLAGTTLLGATAEVRLPLRHWMSERLEMGVLGERVQAGVDGELITFEAPLRFSVEPGALRVLVPKGLPANRQVPPIEAGLQAVRTLRQWLRPAVAVQEESGCDDPHSRVSPDIVGPRRPGETVRGGGPEQPRSRWREESDDESEGRGPMSEQPRGVEHTSVEDEHTWTEQIEIAGSELVDRTKELIAEGNVRRLIIRTPDDEKLLEVPLTAGVVVGGAFTVLAPVLAALGAMAALLARVKVEIVRTERKAEGPPNPQER